MPCYAVKAHVRGTKGADCKGVSVSQVSKKKAPRKPRVKKEKGFVETAETLAIKRKGPDAGARLNRKIDELDRKYDPKHQAAKSKARASIRRFGKLAWGSARR